MAAVTAFFSRHPFWLVLALFAITVGAFVGEPLLRSTGDEKVYVAQALEMAASGSWFLQTLAEVPDYYKGPLFYILLRIGFEIFGVTTMWATLYMNVLGMAVALWCLDKLVRDCVVESFELRAFGGVMLLTSVGVLSHFFSAQMETLAIVFYVVVAYLCHRVVARDSRLWRYLMWTAIGVAGWLKSPLYSVLLGVSALLYIAFCGQLFKKVFTVDGVLSALTGVLVGVAGYLPALVLDGENFYRTYIARETLGKSGGNGVGWTSALFPVFTLYILPWTPLWLFALFAYFRATNFGEVVSIRDYNPAFKLAIAFAAPLLTFFTLHPFRSEIYALPALPFIILVLVALIYRIRPMIDRNWSWLMTVGFVLVLLPILVILALYFRLGLADRWPMAEMTWQLALLGYLVVAFFALIWAEKPRWIPLVFVGLSIVMLWFTKSIGAMEFGGLRKIVDRHPNAEILYLNVEKFLWSEWGYLGFWVGHPVKGVHSWEQLPTKMPSRPTLIICQNDDQVAELTSQLKRFDQSLTYEVENWPRFKVHGKDADSGRSLLAEAWKQGDASALFKPMPVVSITGFNPSH